jgi:hypothetical protein
MSVPVLLFSLASQNSFAYISQVLSSQSLLDSEMVYPVPSLCAAGVIPAHHSQSRTRSQDPVHRFYYDEVVSLNPMCPPEGFLVRALWDIS